MNVQPSTAGDIGRRLALRRREVGLSREDVAERAGVAPGYLEYVEEQQGASPGQAFLLRVAGALGTTVAHLRGGDIGLPPGMGRAAGRPVFTELDPAECRALMAGHGVGRLAVVTPDGPVILPLNYDVIDGAVVFRTSEDSVPSLATGTEVAFEVDRIDDALSQGWSVLVTGPATRVTDEGAARRLDAAAYSGPWAGGRRDVWVSIEPVRITGRRISVE